MVTQSQALIQFGNRVDSFNGGFVIQPHDLAIPFIRFIPRPVFFRNQLQPLFPGDGSLSDLVASEGVMFGKPGDGEVNVIVKTCGSIADAPGGSGVYRRLPFVLIDD